jgi:hypothetical protein
MVSIVKWVTVAWLSIMVVASEGSSDGLKKDQARVCVRWQWVETALEQKVKCTEWATRDCSNRLYPDICKRGG